MNIRRGDIFYIQPGYCVGSEQQAGRPGIIVSNDLNNRHSSVVEVVYLTTQPKKDLPTHVTVRSAPKGGTALCEAIYSVSVERLGDYSGHVTAEEMANIEIAMLISLGIQLTGGQAAAPKFTCSATPPEELGRLRSELSAMTVRYDTLKTMYDSLLAAVLARSGK